MIILYGWQNEFVCKRVIEGYLYALVPSSPTGGLNFSQSSEMLTKEFYFEPDSDYSELNHKRRDLEYQHEIRYHLLDFPRDREYLLDYVPLSERSCGIAPGALRLEIHYLCKSVDA